MISKKDGLIIGDGLNLRTENNYDSENVWMGNG